MVLDLYKEHKNLFFLHYSQLFVGFNVSYKCLSPSQRGYSAFSPTVFTLFETYNQSNRKLDA